MHTIFMLVVLAVILVVTGRGNDFDRGYQAGMAGKHDVAAAYYTKALREGALSRENKARALNNRAIAFMLMGQVGRAMTDLDAAVMVEPTDLVIARNRTAAVSRAEERAARAVAASLQAQERIRLFGFI